MIKNGDVVVYENKRDFRGVVLEDILEMFSEKANINLSKSHSHQPHFPATRPNKPLIRKSVNTITKSFKIAITSTIDIETNKIIHKLIKGNTKNLKELAPVSGKIIKLLYLFLDEEVLLYVKLKNLKFKKIKEKKIGFQNL